MAAVLFFFLLLFLLLFFHHNFLLVVDFLSVLENSPVTFKPPRPSRNQARNPPLLVRGDVRLGVGGLECSSTAS